MKRIRRSFTKEFKLSVIRELENGKNAAQVCRENEIHPVLLSKWKKQFLENPELAFSGKVNISSKDAKIAKLERLVGQLYAENEFLKKTLSFLEIKLQEYRKKGGKI